VLEIRLHGRRHPGTGPSDCHHQLEDPISSLSLFGANLHPGGGRERLGDPRQPSASAFAGLIEANVREIERHERSGGRVLERASELQVGAGDASASLESVTLSPK
jgi:hypothetical protein